MTSVCLTSVAYIGPTSRLERPRKTKISKEVSHVTCDSDTTFKVKRSKVKVTRPLYSSPCWRVRQLQRWAWERVGRVKLLLCCRRLLGGARHFGAHGGGERQGHIVAAARLQLVFSSNTTVLKMYYIFVTYFYCKLLYFIKYSNTANYVNYPLIIFFSDNEPME